MKVYRTTHAFVNVPALRHNISMLRSLAGPSVKFMAVVKADAYGHGAVGVAKAVQKNVDYLSVANIVEAIELKEAGIRKPVFILSETSPLNAPFVVRNGFIQTVYTPDLAKALSKEAVRQGKKATVHMKVDTGMGRIGVRVGEAMKLYDLLSSLPGIRVEGVFTHLAKAEEPHGFTTRQLARFRSFADRVDGEGLIFHSANSAGALYHKESRMDMVRIGLSMYGLYPPGGDRTVIKLQPVLEFKSRVVYMKSVPAGTPLSYGSTYRTSRESKIATIPVGYADGLPRALSNKGHVLINGKRYPIVGRVCMDLSVVNVGDDPVKVGDEVVIIGSQGKETISVDELAGQSDTISYEIICGIGKRVPRIYVS